MKTNLILIFVFSFIGILNTLYLIYNKIKGMEVACPFFPEEWCYKVQHSPQSKTFGIPNSIAGLVMYIVIFVLAFLWYSNLIAFWPLQAIITFGFLFSTYFLFVQGFVLKAFCTWCVLSAISFTVMFIALWF